MVAFIMASKYIHDSLRSIIYTSSNRKLNSSIISTPITPPTSPRIPINSASTVIQSITTALANDTKSAEKSDAVSQIVTPVSSPPSETTAPKDNERNLRIARMEQEFLFFLNYDLSVQDPSLLVMWAQSYQVPEKTLETEEEYTSADEGDDEMDDEDK